MGQQDNTIRLEGRYISTGHAVPDPLTVECKWVRCREPKFKNMKAPDGTTKQRSVITHLTLDVAGLPDSIIQEKGNWTHILSPLLPHGESELIEIVPLGSNRARFTVRYHE